MTGTEQLERDLRRDLTRLDARAGDERFLTDLYRALANRAWSRAGARDGGHVALSRSLAEDAVNDLRRSAGHEPLALDGSGGEGDLADSVARAMEELGWRSQPLDTDRHDPQHAARTESPPPRDSGGPGAGEAWEDEAHEDAQRNREGRVGA